MISRCIQEGAQPGMWISYMPRCCSQQFNRQFNGSLSSSPNPGELSPEVSDLHEILGIRVVQSAIILMLPEGSPENGRHMRQMSLSQAQVILKRFVAGPLL